MPDRAAIAHGDRPLRIALLTHSVLPRGGVVHSLELAEALHDQGHAVTLLAPALPGQQLFRPARCEVDLVRVAATATGTADMVTARRAAYVRHLSQRLRHTPSGAPFDTPFDAPFDVFHAQDAISGNALADLCDAGAIGGFVRTVHHLDHFDDERLMAWQRRAVDRASQVCAVSRTWRDTLAADHGVDAALVPNGVNLQRYASAADATDARVRHTLGLRPGGPLLLAVGGVEARKNSVRILQAFLLLRAEHPQAQLVVAGGASLLDHHDHAREFHALLAASGVRCGPHGAVVVTGTVPDADMPALLRAADALLMPSLREGFGLVVLEALASGTPAVVSRIAPFTEHLDADESTGHCCWADPLSVPSIADAMRRALQPGHAAALALGPPDVCRRFSWPASAQRHAQLYRAHLARHGAPAPRRAAAHPA